MLGSIIKVQTHIVNNGENQAHISHFIGDMTREIKNAFGNNLPPESESLI